MYACGNCDRCEDVGSGEYRDELGGRGECEKRKVLACIDDG